MSKEIRILVFILCSFGAAVLTPVKAQELLDYPLDTINGEEVYKYEVERSVGLYRIGVNFKVKQDDILRLNPQLHEHGVRFGETLYIPTGRKAVRQTQAKVIRQTVKETVVQADSAVIQSQLQAAMVEVIAQAQQPDSAFAVAPEQPENTAPRSYELAIMLPFESQQTKRSGNAERIMEFYQGALLAVHDLQQPNAHFKLRVYDTERSERRVNALCDSTELDSVQGILGLVYPIQIERMAAWCAVHNVPLLLPFSDDSEISKKPYVLQFNSTDRQEADTLCQWMQARTEQLHCVAVDVRESDMSESVRTLRKHMQEHGIPASTMALRDLLNDSVAYALDSTKENLIILHSDKFQQVRILLPHLAKIQSEGYRLRIVSQYSWNKEEIGLPQVYTSMFTVNEGRGIYEDNWKNYYVNDHLSEAPRFDLLGYDLMKALVAWLQGGKEVTGLQSVIRWKQDNNGGYQNECIQVVEK
jgi:hypothetical protein